MSNIVFLDSATLPVPIPRPWSTDRWAERPSTREHEVVEALADADIAITNKVALRADALRHLPRLKYICVTASGYDSVDLDYCRAHDIQVSNVPAYAAASVAEHVIACIFMLRRQMLAYSSLAASSAWTASNVFCVHAAPIREIRGATLGLIGSGAIGSEVARLAEALGMHVLFSERKGHANVRPRYTPFDEVIRTSDVISLHCPSTAETQGLIGEREFAMMRPTSVLINTARGALVDERALEAALLAQTIAGAALDVLQIEPPHEQHRFVTRQPDNLLLTPHVAWAGTSAVEVLAQAVSSNIASFLERRTLNRVA
ncbi:glycerate dehydrogenase [Caballeronia udeis]|uniref:Glycerate dehydrogenase n=1 Tax=Caballeronia udeis TaxID=1232866 RepID=A0A158JJ00_9BURK|nr:NAD(P)-dependent oxidoreductase [Caballeronia udeis]SAL68459.1 glycerate dehydrogenase [Caballeronia udeis]